MNEQSELAACAAEATGAADAGLGLNPLVGFGTADLAAGVGQIARHALLNPLWTIEHQLGLATLMIRAWTGETVIEPTPSDRRFADPVWRDSQLYRALLQSYLAWRDSLDGWVAKAGFDQKNEQRARMALSLFGDAVAPTNFWLGNPAAVRRFVETGGASAVRGLWHMLRDLAANRGMPSQVDKRAFRVGGTLGASKGAVVFRNAQAELIQYAPTTAKVRKRPLLIVPPQINKFYLFDLAPGRSIIGYLLANGFQVFAVSWRNPMPEHRNWGLEIYLKALVELTDVVRAISESKDLNIAAACSGGITASVLLGHLVAKKDRRINAATLLVTVLDTAAESQIGHLITREAIEAARATSQQKGVLEGAELGRMFAWMRPNDLIWNYWANNYLLGNDPPAFDLLFWNADTTRLPARLHSDFLDLLLHNPLVRRNGLMVAGTPIDLSRVTCDSFIVGGTTDHITPWQACFATTSVLGGRKEFALSSSGHIQSVINPPGGSKAKFFLNPELPSDPEAWLAGAQQHNGSWWDHWREWLTERSGPTRRAPATLGHRRYPPEAEAPGTYVFDA